MRCLNCQFDYRSGKIFFKSFENKIELVCSSCGHPRQSDRLFLHPLWPNSPKNQASPECAEPRPYTPKPPADKVLTAWSSKEGQGKMVEN